MRRMENEVRVGDVRVDWELIRPGLEIVKEKGNAEWRLEDVYALCRNGDAFLYIVDEGFSIVRRVVNSFTLEIELFIMVSFSTGECNIKKFQPYLEDLAKEIGATSMTLQSPRRGLERHGWEIEQINYKWRL